MSDKGVRARACVFCLHLTEGRFTALTGEGLVTVASCPSGTSSSSESEESSSQTEAGRVMTAGFVSFSTSIALSAILRIGEAEVVLCDGG